MEPASTEVTPAQPELEREKLEWQIASQKLDLSLRERELSLKIQEAGRSNWANPLFLAVVAAVVGLLGNAAVAIIQGDSSIRLKETELMENILLEKQKLTSNLILESIKTGDITSAATNLLFLAKIGLITEDVDNLTKYLSNPLKVPVLPSPNATQGTNQRIALNLTNSCDKSVKAVIGFFADDGTWRFFGWLNLAPGSTNSVPVPSSNRKLYLYAQTSDGRATWEGDNQLKFGESVLPFKSIEIPDYAMNTAGGDAAIDSRPFAYIFRCE